MLSRICGLGWLAHQCNILMTIVLRPNRQLNRSAITSRARPKQRCPALRAQKGLAAAASTAKPTRHSAQQA